MKAGVFLVLLFGACFFSFAQKKYKFGVKGGLSIVDFKQSGNSVGNQISDVNFRVSYHVGGFVQYSISDKIDMQSGVFFSSQGGSRSVEFIEDFNSSDISTDRTNFVYNYLNVPLLVKYNLSKSWSVKTGPQLGFLLSADVKNQYVFIDGIQFNFDSNVKDDASLIDVSWSLEAGYEFESGLLVDVTYNLGLSNTIDAENSDFKRENRVFQLSLGYKF